jgi:hypothetical protein
MILSEWNLQNDTLKMTLSEWHSSEWHSKCDIHHNDTLRMTFSEWHSQNDTLRMTLSEWHSQNDTLRMTLSEWHSQNNIHQNNTQRMTFIIMTFNRMMPVSCNCHFIKNTLSLNTIRSHCCHQAIGVHKQYLDVMGPIFCQALRPILQAEGLWDNDVRTAWLRFFRCQCYKTFFSFSPNFRNKLECMSLASNA